MGVVVMQAVMERSAHQNFQVSTGRLPSPTDNDAE